MATSDTLTRDENTIAEHHFKTTDGVHTLYVQEWGNKKGTPIMFLHGGPGSGCSDSSKELFDPTKHYVIFHDQRGSGLSKPANSMTANTTQLLIEDIEQIRQYFSLEDFVIHGRSWGATLGLCYAIEYPQHVKRIITGGVFLGTSEEHDWIDKGGFSTFYPEVWDQYNQEQNEIVRYAQLAGPTVYLDDRYKTIDPSEFEPGGMTLDFEYSKSGWFLPEGYILKSAHKLTMPVHIVQGRYDMLTPPKAAYDLHQALPNSTLQWTIAGHSRKDRANVDATKALLSSL